MKNFAIACAGLAVMMASPIFASDANEEAMHKAALKAVLAHTVSSTTASVVSIPGPKMLGTPAPTVPSVIAEWFMAGEDDLGVGLPCFNCAPAPTGGYGLAVPYVLGYIPTTVTELDYIMSFEDNSATATCDLGFSLMQGTTVLDSESISAAIYPSLWYVQFPRTTPTASGDATLYGFVTCGGVEEAVAKTRIVLQ